MIINCYLHMFIADYAMTEIGKICCMSLNDTTRKRVSSGKLVPGNQVKVCCVVLLYNISFYHIYI